MHSDAINISNHIDEIGRVANLVDAFGQRHALPQRVVHDMNIALDEVISNIIYYAYDDRGRHEIRVRLSLTPGEFSAEVEDDGKPFDPTCQPRKIAAGVGVAEHPVGGLGLHFVQALMDNVRYDRAGTINRLRLRKRMAEQSERRIAGAARMEVNISREQEVTIVEVSGRVDSSNAGALRERLTGIIGGGGSALLVDLQRVDYMTSAGFWSLLAAARLLEANLGRLVLCGIKGEVERLFDLTTFSEVFAIYPDRKRALAAIRGAS
ncbi:MAG TPA: anti-sigma factor antagonist [Burkholderiales bacterium]|nr:anti-sigma factor antagonist [Burkholderiales bacterium]